MRKVCVGAGGALLLALATGLCALTAQAEPPASGPSHGHATALLEKIALDPATEDRILALIPEHIADGEVRELLSLAPAPRIINLQGSLALVTMQPFAEFLVAMGYPEERIRNPKDGALSYTSFADSEELAGSLAWYYETEGMMPILIGHSQGGMLVMRILHELAGEFHDAIPVWNPLTGEAERRTTIVDPLNGVEKPVLGLKVPYAAALATGRLMRVLLGQWTMLSRLRKVPDTAEEFTGFSIEWDAIAGNFPGAEPYRATGSAVVRNVTLPLAYSHITLPRTRHLAANWVTRAWINQYVPGPEMPALPDGESVDTTNIIHAAEIWYSVKKHWCLEAQRLIRAKRSTIAAMD